MNIPLLKPKQKGWSQVSIGHKITLSLFVWMVAAFGLNAQVDCNIIMACNDNIQVSLGEDCTELLAPDMILEAPAYDDSFYSVTLWRENGAVVGDNILRQSMIGETLSAKIQLNGCDISCWGNLTVEDKLAPNFVSCISPVEVECEDNLNPGVVVPRPIAVDACTSVDLYYDDYTEKLLCDQPYTMTVTRRWIATDAYGNKDTCVQIINVLRASIDDVTFPKDYVDGDALECGAAIPYLPNGAPSPEFTGYPNGVECPNINYYYDDIIFDLCGGGVKVLRQWNVLDWCTGRDTIGNQVIKVLDTRAPICVAPNDFVHEINTDEGECTGTFDVPAPNIIFECSDYDYIVGYKLRDENGDPFENPIYDNAKRINNPDGSYFWRITGLPQDTTWIVYTITDACNHSTQCFTEVFVNDDEKPSAICEGYSVVTLGDDGWADVDAISIDDHSKDNCSIVDYQIKRLTNSCGYPTDLDFGPYVNFCCDDVSEDDNFYVKVVLRVFDQAGNYNDCVANVKVQDKKDPTIQCPANRDVQCGTDTSPSVTGTATGTDNCNVEITFRDLDNLSSCGKGTISRRWTATDPGGRTRSCTQTIRVIDFDPFTIDDVMFPKDITINGCSEEDADPLLTGSIPTYTNDDCVELAVSYEDTRFEIQDACFKITRKWRIADWCDYNTQNPYYIEGVQKITFLNTEKPVFVSDCSNRVIESDDIDCEEYVEHSAEATDDCTPSEDIKYRWEYDENNDGTIDDFGYSSFTADVYPTGIHRFTFFATDLCDNTTTCSYLFTVKDAKAPTPVCHRSVTWGIDENGQAEVWASDFNLKSFDLCDPDEDLIFSFDEAGNELERSFNCNDIPNGIAAEIELRMYVTDTYGNKEYCEVTLILQDSESNDACTDDPNAMGRVAGTIMHPTSKGMVDIDVHLSEMTSADEKTSFTDADGHFEFSETEFYGEYDIKPTSNADILNGVSTLDLVHIQRHILEIAEFDQATNLIAADINADNKVTAADLVALRKVILGITNEYQNNNSWRFLPATHEFEDESYPWGFPENIIIEKLLIDQMKADFTAIKIGDVNNSSSANAREEQSENRSGAIDLMIDNKHVLPGDLIEIPVYAGSDMDVMGLQLNVKFDNYTFDLATIKSGALEVNYNNYHIDADHIKLSLAEQNVKSIQKGIVLFTLVATASEENDLSSFEINPEGISSEMYNADFEIDQVDLILREVEQVESVVVEVRNTPNPFHEKTSISLELEKETQLKVSVYDVSGKEIFTKNVDGHPGNNFISINSRDLDEKPGLYIYNIQNGEKTYTGKMILVK